MESNTTTTPQPLAVSDVDAPQGRPPIYVRAQSLANDLLSLAGPVREEYFVNKQADAEKSTLSPAELSAPGEGQAETVPTDMPIHARMRKLADELLRFSGAVEAEYPHAGKVHHYVVFAGLKPGIYDDV